MNPLRLRARNYRTFQELDLELPAGCCAVIGENGAGKSSIVNVIDLALFGPPDGIRTLAPFLTDDCDDDAMMVELEFEHAGEVFRVRRSYSAKGRGQTKIDFEVHVFSGANGPSDAPGGWDTLTRETAAATQVAIEETLGLTRQTFRASSFLAQGDGAAFPDAEPRERKRILAEVLGLDRYDRLLERARTDRRAAEDRLQRIAGALEQAEETLKVRPGLEQRLGECQYAAQDAATRVVEHEAKLADLRERFAALQQSREQLAMAEREVAACEGTLAELMRASAKAEQARTRAAELERSLGPIRDIAAQVPAFEEQERELRAKAEAYAAAVSAREQARREHERILVDRNRLLGEASELNEKAHALRQEADHLEQRTDDGAKCDRCAQTLGAEARARAIASYRADAVTLDAEAKAKDDQAAALAPALADAAAKIDDPPAAPDGDALPALEFRLRSARDAVSQVAARETELRALEAIIADAGSPDFVARMEAAKTAATDARARLEALEPVSDRDLEEARAEGNRIALALDAARVTLENARAEVAKMTGEIDRLTLLADEVKAQQAERATLHAEIDLLALLERAYGRDGIPALIVENAAIPQIELEANRILSELGTVFRVELRTQRALKGGDGLRETLDIVVYGEAAERSYETFSGGERTRINLALRIALARLLAHRRGAESRLLALDEPEYLDEAGTAALVDVLRGLTSDFDRVYLVSHVPGLRDAFDQVIEVVKDGTRSRVEDGVPAVREEVVAA